MPQTSFDFPAQPRCPAAWSRALSDQLGRPVNLTYGRARRNVVVARSHGERLEVRLNQSFATAPPHVAEALASWLHSGKRARRACATLDRWIEELTSRLGPPARSSVRIEPLGTHFDLGALTRVVVAEQFAGELVGDWGARVTWGRRTGQNARKRRTLQLGSFDPERGLIRIHPVLDQRAVPRFFVSYVLFHELLHAALAGDGHVRPHPPEFRERERAYPEFARAVRWQEERIGELMNSARTGKAIANLRTPGSS